MRLIFLLAIFVLCIYGKKLHKAKHAHHKTGGKRQHIHMGMQRQHIDMKMPDISSASEDEELRALGNYMDNEDKRLVENLQNFGTQEVNTETGNEDAATTSDYEKVESQKETTVKHKHAHQRNHKPHHLLKGHVINDAMGHGHLSKSNMTGNDLENLHGFSKDVDSVEPSVAVISDAVLPDSEHKIKQLNSDEDEKSSPGSKLVSPIYSDGVALNSKTVESDSPAGSVESGTPSDDVPVTSPHMQPGLRKIKAPVRVDTVNHKAYVHVADLLKQGAPVNKVFNMTADQSAPVSNVQNSTGQFETEQETPVNKVFGPMDPGESEQEPTEKIPDENKQAQGGEAPTDEKDDGKELSEGKYHIMNHHDSEHDRDKDKDKERTHSDSNSVYEDQYKTRGHEKVKVHAHGVGRLTKEMDKIVNTALEKTGSSIQLNKKVGKVLKSGNFSQGKDKEEDKSSKNKEQKEEKTVKVTSSGTNEKDKEVKLKGEKSALISDDSDDKLQFEVNFDDDNKTQNNDSELSKSKDKVSNESSSLNDIKDTPKIEEKEKVKSLAENSTNDNASLDNKDKSGTTEEDKTKSKETEGLLKNVADIKEAKHNKKDEKDAKESAHPSTLDKALIKGIKSLLKESNLKNNTDKDEEQSPKEASKEKLVVKENKLKAGSSTSKEYYPNGENIEDVKFDKQNLKKNSTKPSEDSNKETASHSEDKEQKEGSGSTAELVDDDDDSKTISAESKADETKKLEKEDKDSEKASEEESVKEKETSKAKAPLQEIDDMIAEESKEISADESKKHTGDKSSDTAGEKSNDKQINISTDNASKGLHLQISLKSHSKRTNDTNVDTDFVPWQTGHHLDSHELEYHPATVDDATDAGVHSPGQAEEVGHIYN